MRTPLQNQGVGRSDGVFVFLYSSICLSQPDLYTSQEKLFSKIRLLALMEVSYFKPYKRFSVRYMQGLLPECVHP